MKVGVITNLINIDNFVKSEMLEANTASWMQATGGNTGNVAFVHGVQGLLDNQYSVVNWGDNAELVNKHFDQLVICCANQIGAHVNLSSWASRLKAFDLPTTFIGLGAQSHELGMIPDIPDGTKQFLEITKSLRINSKHSNIITRGDFSSMVLEECGVSSSPFGCPSQFISLQDGLGKRCLEHQKRAKYERVITAAGNPWHSSSVLETTLTEIVDNYRGDYVLQHPQTLIQLAMGEIQNIQEDKIMVLERVYKRIGNWEQIKAWFESYCVFFADAQNWMHYSRHFTLAIGPRYHGVALPIQAGVPGKVISIDSRTAELAITTGIPHIHYKQIESLSASELVASCKWNANDAKHYDMTRKQNAKRYKDFFNNNQLPTNLNLINLAE